MARERGGESLLGQAEIFQGFPRRLQGFGRFPAEPHLPTNSKVSTSIATVLGLATQEAQCLDDMKNASKDRKALRLEINSLRSVLLCFKTLPQPGIPSEESYLTAASLDLPYGPLHQVQQALKRLAVILAPTSGLRGLGEMVAWPFEKTKLKEILDIVKRQKSLILLALQKEQLSQSSYRGCREGGSSTKKRWALLKHLRSSVKTEVANSNKVLEFRGMLDMLLQNGSDLESRNKDGMTSLAWAAKHDRVEIAAYLLGKGAAIEAKDCRGQTPLLWAAKRGCKDIVKLLVERGANVATCDNQNQTPYSWAIKRGHKETVQLLIQIGGISLGAEDKWYNEKTYETLELSIDDWAMQINSRDKDGRTILSRAAEFGHAASSLLLINHGADLELEDAQGYTPLLWVAKRGHDSIVKLLLDHQANIEVTDTWFKQTSLSWAVRRGQRTVVQLLIEHKANIEATDKQGRTALWLASKDGLESVVQLLLQHKANPKARDSSDRDAFMIAKENQHKQVLKLLKGTHLVMENDPGV